MIDSTSATEPVAEPSPVSAPPPLRDWKTASVDLFLVALVIIGVIFRFSWTNWNQDTDLHPDEYGLTSTITRLATPESLEDYFNTRLSTISPYQKYDEAGLPTDSGPDNRMRWGQFPIIIIRWASEATGNTDYIQLRLMGRRLSALADTLSLLVLFLLARRLYNYRVALLATALSALAVMQIQQSHFMTADNFAVLFAVMSMYGAVRVAEGGGYRWYAFFGAAFGMAVASRINLVPLFGELLVAVLIADAVRLAKGKDDLAAGISHAGLRIALAALVALVAFRVAHPMAFRAETGDTHFFTFTPNSDWLDSLAVAQAESSGAGGGPPGEQWTNRTALVFPFVNMVLWGMGLPLGLMAWAGLVWAAKRSLLHHEWRAHLLPLTWAGGYFLFMGTRWVKSIRYFLPIYPFMAIFAAWGLLELWALAGRMRHHPAASQKSVTLLRVAAGVLFAAVTLGTLTWAWGFTSIYRNDNTRIQASRWIYQNVPAAFNLQIETANGQIVNEPIPTPYGTVITGDYALLLPYRATTDGVVRGVSIGHAVNMFDANIHGTVRVTLAVTPDGSQTLATADVPISAGGDNARGEGATANLGPATVKAGETYHLLVSAPSGGPFKVEGATVASESWDEGLPLRIEGRDAYGGLYRGLTMEVRWGDDENKRQMFVNNLEQVDYLFLASQRGLWSVSRLPNTYPLTNEYYRALFDGRLGFELVATFTSPIVIGPLQVSDVGGSVAWGESPQLPVVNNSPFAAEEAFSVYDHAPVWIFKKRADFDINAVRLVLYAIDLENVVNQGPREATAAPTLLMLPPQRVQAQRAGGTWDDMFNRQNWLNKYQPLGVVVWWLAVVALGWLVFPIAFVSLGGLWDKGYALSRNLALLLIAWLAWLLGSFQIAPFTQLTLWGITLLWAAVSAVVLWRRAPEIWQWLKHNRQYVLRTEVLALSLFVFFLLIRWGNADLWHPAYGGEKPMDFSYFNAVLKSTSFPPYDPWFAGGYLNYYYFGFVIVGTITKMLGIVPSFAYNLILPMLFSLAGVGAYAVAYNLVAAHDDGKVANAPFMAGVAAALLFVVLGNLGETSVIKQALLRAAGETPLTMPFLQDVQRLAIGFWRIYVEGVNPPVGTGEWYWNATRVIPDAQTTPITEFPFFTFLYADLHAHMIVLSMTVLALGWCASLVLGATVQSAGDGKWRRVEAALLWVVGGLAFGVIQPSNLSDYQTFWLLGCVAIAYAELRKRQTIDTHYLLATGLRCTALVGLAIALFQPYSAWRGEGYGSVELWKGDKTPINAYLTIHGLFLFAIVTLLLVETRRWMQRTPLSDLRGWWRPSLFALAVFAALMVELYVLGYKIALVALPLTVWTGLLMIRPALEPPKRVALGLIGLGLLLTMVVEVVVAKGDIGRMNTVFKFYLQVWTFFSIAAGAALPWIVAQMPEWMAWSRRLWRAAAVVLVAIAASYTVMATAAKVNDRMAPHAPRTLDGMIYMAYSRYADQGQTIDLKWDYEAIVWMQESVEGSPVIVEAHAVEYRWGSRYTINTGLPGVVGWNWHQRQQRVVVPDRLVTNRVADIADFYSTIDEGDALRFLQKYDVRFIVVGEYEKAYYPPTGLDKFSRLVTEGLLKVAYQNEGTVIYEVIGGG